MAFTADSADPASSPGPARTACVSRTSHSSLPDLSEVQERAHVVRLPMNIRFRGITERELMLIEGPQGWAEWGAFPEYEPPEAAQWLACALEMGWQGPPAGVDGQWVPINGTIPACAPERVPELLARYPGARAIKVKVAEHGQTLSDDLGRVRAVRQHRPDAAIRLDANGGWSVPEALRAAQLLLADGPLDYLEQPCRTLDELAELRSRLAEAGLSVRVAADESIRRAEDPYRAIRMEAVDVAIVKAAPLGGPRKVMELAGEAAAHGVAVTVSSAIDSVVGMYAGLAAAAAIDSQPAGLATGALIARDVGRAREIVDGNMLVEPREPEPGRLAECAVAPERERWWRERLAAAWEYLPCGGV